MLSVSLRGLTVRAADMHERLEGPYSCARVLVPMSEASHHWCSALSAR